GEEGAVQGEREGRAVIDGADDEAELAGAGAFADGDLAAQEVPRRNAARIGNDHRGCRVVHASQQTAQDGRFGDDDVVDDAGAGALEGVVVHAERHGDRAAVDLAAGEQVAGVFHRGPVGQDVDGLRDIPVRRRETQ